MIRTADNHTIYEFSAANPPVACADVGATIVFVTKDCFSGQFTDPSHRISGIDFNQINPATGPVHIEGAVPGDVLAPSCRHA